MTGIFISGVDEVDTVLAIRSAAIDTIKNGGTVLTGWSSEGTSATMIQGLSLSTIIAECNYFLRKEDPELYGGQVIKRLQPRYI